MALAEEETQENRHLYDRMIEQAALKFSQGAPPRGRGHDPAKHTTDGGQRATKYSEKKAAAAAESAARLANIPKFIVPKSVVEAMRHSKPIEPAPFSLDSAPKAEIRPKVKPLIVRNVKKKKSAVSKCDKVQPPASYRRMGAGRPPLSKRQASDRYLEGNELGGVKRSRRMVIAVQSSDDDEEEMEEEEEEMVSRVSPAPKRRPVVFNETLAAGKAAVTAKVTGVMRGGVSRRDGIVAATPPALSQSDSVIANRKAFGDLFSKVCPASGAVNLG